MDKLPISIMIHDLSPWGGQDRSMLEIAWQLNKTFPLEIHSYSLEGYDQWPDMKHIKYESLIKRPIIFKYLSYHLQSRRRLKLNASAIIQSTGTASLKSDVVQVQFIHHTWEKIRRKLPADKISQSIGLKHFYHSWLTNYKLKLEKQIYSPQKQYIAISHGVKKELMEHFHIPSENIHIIYHGVDTQHFHPPQNDEKSLAARQSFRKNLGCEDDDILILQVGALNSRKGILNSLYMMEALKKNYFNKVKFVAVGKGDINFLQKKTTKLGINDSVFFAEHSRDIRQFYWAADLFMLPSFYEPFGLVVLEAMACGLPVLTTSTTGAAELIHQGEEGLLFDRWASPEELATKIEPLLKFPEQAKEMGLKARKLAEQHSWDKVGQNYRGFYADLIRRKSALDEF